MLKKYTHDSHNKAHFIEIDTHIQMYINILNQLIIFIEISISCVKYVLIKYLNHNILVLLNPEKQYILL